MNVLHILPQLNHGGVETSTVSLAIQQCHQGQNVWVLSEGGMRESILTQAGVTPLQGDVARKNPFLFSKAVKNVCDIVRRYDIHVIHTHSRWPAWIVWAARRQISIPWVSTVHGLHRQTSWLKRQYNHVLLKADHVIVPSHFVLRTVQGKIPDDKISLIPEGVETEVFDPLTIPHVRDHQRCAHGLDPHHFCVILPARLTRLKGHDIALQALEHIRAMLPPVKLGLFRDNQPSSYHTELETFIQRHRLEAHVFWISSRENIRDIYAMSDLIILPSVVPEAFGRVLVEAQLMERWVIATGPGGSEDVCAETGDIIPRFDSEALAERILNFAHKTTEQQAVMGQTARQAMLRNFSLERMKYQTDQVYQKALQT